MWSGKASLRRSTLGSDLHYEKEPAMQRFRGSVLSRGRCKGPEVGLAGKASARLDGTEDV